MFWGFKVHRSRILGTMPRLEPCGILLSKPFPSLAAYAPSSPRVGCTHLKPVQCIGNVFPLRNGPSPSFWAMLPPWASPSSLSKVWTLVLPERLRSHKTFVNHCSVSCLHSAVLWPLSLEIPFPHCRKKGCCVQWKRRPEDGGLLVGYHGLHRGALPQKEERDKNRLMGPRNVFFILDGRHEPCT